MTMPHLMNCDHQDAGWCLGCVRKMYEELEETRAILNEKCGSDQWFDAMNKARIQQSLPKEYLESLIAFCKQKTPPKGFGDDEISNALKPGTIYEANNGDD